MTAQLNSTIESLADASPAAELAIGQRYSTSIMLDGRAVELVLRHDPQGRITPEEVLLRSASALEVLERLGEYAGMARLFAEDRLDYRALERRLATDVYVFGAHQVGLLLARLFMQKGGRVQAFFDNDPRKHGSSLDGIPVIGFEPETLPDDALIVLGSGRYSGAIRDDLRARGRDNILTMHQFLAAVDAPYITESSFRNYRSNLIDQRLAFLSAFLSLDDERSRQVFDGLVAMRLDLGIAAPGIRSPFADEYLEPGLVTAEDLRYYVDAGAYNGDTLLKIESRFGPVEAACLFEPERLAFLECQARFAGREGIRVLQAAMTEVPCEIPAPRANSCDVLGVLTAAEPSDAPSSVPGFPLDETAQSGVTLIKLDIEGAEASALRGAARVIQRDRPTLCVCAYHRSDDLWRLVDTVLAIRGDYRVGVRHYSDIVDDTTLYFY